MIPLPTDVIITGHFDTSINSIHENIPNPIHYLYLNQIEVQNSTLIVDYQKDKYPFDRLTVNENGFSGVTDMSLEYSITNHPSVKDPYVENAREYNKWPTLDEMPKWKAQYPAKNPPVQHWNDLGIYYYNNDKTDPNSKEIIFTTLDDHPARDPRICDIYEPGTRWSEQPEELQPYFWPSNYTVFSTCSDNHWLFDESRTVGGNTFIGGGKR